MKWSSLLLALLTLPLLFNSVPLEVLRLKTFDALVPQQNPTGHFTILNITEQDLDKMGYFHTKIEWVVMMSLLKPYKVLQVL